MKTHPKVYYQKTTKQSPKSNILEATYSCCFVTPKNAHFEPEKGPEMEKGKDNGSKLSILGFHVSFLFGVGIYIYIVFFFQTVGTTTTIPQVMRHILAVHILPKHHHESFSASNWKTNKKLLSFVVISVEENTSDMHKKIVAWY